MDDPFRESPWWSLLEEDLGGAFLRDLLEFVDALGAYVYPPRRDVFRALELTPPNRTKAVIIGQDPYRGPKQAHGLCSGSARRSSRARSSGSSTSTVPA